MRPWPARPTMASAPLALILLSGIAGTGCAGRPGRSPEAAPAIASPDAPRRLAAAPDRVLTTGDVRLRYRVVGSGEPVVLLHPLGASLEMWGRFADSLATQYRVIALDQRGFGQSSKFADPARFGAEMSTDVVRLLDHLRVRRAHVVGYSLGAAVASHLAVRAPDRVATVSLVAGPF